MPSVLVTGANRGLGLEFVRQYAADGWAVIAATRAPAKAEALQKLAKVHSNIRTAALDVADAASIAALAKELNGAAVDVLINNAGIYSGLTPPPSAIEPDPSQHFATLDAEAWMRVLRINTVAPIMLAKALAPAVAASAKRVIVNITSFMGSIGRGGQGAVAYRTSKAALNMAMVSLQGDLAAQKIIMANLHPGWVKTDMGSASADLTPEQSITGMRKVIAALTPKDAGTFLDYKGQTLPW